MKTGILTFHFVYNYGAMLQAYALYKNLEIKGIECEIIDYRPHNIDVLYRPNWKDIKKNPKGNIAYYLRKKRSKTNFTSFENFLSQQFKMNKIITSSEESCSVWKEYDAIIVGSDQVWNPFITGYDANYLLASIPEKVIKISYGASLGKNTIDKRWREALKLYLHRFDMISVREKQGCKIIEELIDQEKIKCVPDPVFLFGSKYWQDIMRPVDQTPPKFILYYILREEKKLDKKVLRLQEQLRIPVISIHPLYRIIKQCDMHMSDIGPEQFLWLLYHAEYVCTDSFHATAFSMIFGKKIVVEMDKEQGGRITNLLNMLKIQENEIKIKENIISYYQAVGESNEVKKLENESNEFIEEIILLLEGSETK